MAKTATVRARIEPELKQKAEQILDEIGLKPSLAVQILYRCIVEDDGFPVSLKRPNAVTRAALEDAMNNRKLEEIDSIYDLLEEGSEEADAGGSIQEGRSPRRKTPTEPRKARRDRS
jgi:DNA-damage-inducible protein J